MKEESQIRRQPVAGLILAGGKSRRMGVDKSELQFQGMTFVEQLVSRFRTAGLPVVVVVSNLSEPRVRASAIGESVTFVCDERTDAGPLEGIRIGLATLEEITEFAFVISCDSPLLKLEFVDALISRIDAAQAIVPRSGTEIYGTSAIYRTDIHPLIEQELSSGNHSVKAMLKHLNVQFVEVDDLRAVDPKLESLININTPEEYTSVVNRFDR